MEVLPFKNKNFYFMFHIILNYRSLYISPFKTLKNRCWCCCTSHWQCTSFIHINACTPQMCNDSKVKPSYTIINRNPVRNTIKVIIYTFTIYLYPGWEGVVKMYLQSWFNLNSIDGGTICLWIKLSNWCPYKTNINSDFTTRW